MPPTADGPPLPLAGVRVLDFTRILSGPYCTLLLADLGADVIKVERPGRGDDTRWWGPPFLDGEPGHATYFASLNRGKRSVALDLQDPADRERVQRLAEHVEVVIENFRPGTAADLGLDPGALRRRNPRLVTCSISGWGADGAYAGLPGTEIVVEAMSGLMEVTGPTDGLPVRFGIAMVDIATGLTAATRVVAALLHAGASGEGAHVECSLYGTALAALGTLITNFTASGEEPTRWGSHHPTVCPYGGFPAADGLIVTGVINDRQWEAFCEAIELPRLGAAPGFATNALRVERRAEVEGMVATQLATRPVAHWLERLGAAGLLAAPVRTVGDAVADPATRALGLFVGLAGHPGVLSPKLDGVPAPGAEQLVPALGEHTEEVLAELLGE